MGVAVLVVGRIARIVFRQRGDDIGLLRQKQSISAVELEIKAFEVSSGRELIAIGRTGQASTNAMAAIEVDKLSSPKYRAELVKLSIREAGRMLTTDLAKAAEKLTWEGKIARIIGNKVYLNSGHESGLVGGDILKVLTPGEDIHDPESGAFLGKTEGQLKGTLEVMDFIGPDGAVSQMHTGGGFQEGDIVRLY